MAQKLIAWALSIGFFGTGVVLLIDAIHAKLADHLQDAFNSVFLALAVFFIALAARQIFAAVPLTAVQPRRDEARFTRDAPPDVRRRALLLDAWAIGIPLLCLVDMIALALSYQPATVYPAPGKGLVEGDYYRYVNMSFDHGDPRYVFAQPFLYRVLVPFTVHVLSHVGVPFRTGFFSITCLTLCVSTVALYFLARGAGLSRFASSSTALVFTLLYWTVTYNVSDYFLIDTTTEAFIATMVLCVQRGRFIPVIILGTIGVACKETMYLPISFAAIHLILPYLTPISTTLGDLARLRIGKVVRLVPTRNWLLLGPMLICPAIVTLALRHFIPLAHPLPLSVLWPSYWHIHQTFGIERTFAASLWYAFGIMIFLALGAMALRLWPRARWSGWGLLAVIATVVYSFMLSGDAQRLTIITWPFVLVLAALMINEISQRLRVSEMVIWPIIIFLMLLNFPPYPKGFSHFDNVTYLGTRLLPQANHWQAAAYVLLFATVGILLVVGYLLFQPSNATKLATVSADLPDRETLQIGTIPGPASE